MEKSNIGKWRDKNETAFSGRLTYNTRQCFKLYSVLMLIVF